MPTPADWLGTPLTDLDISGRRWHPVVVGTRLHDHAKAVQSLLAKKYQVIAPMCRVEHCDKTGRTTFRVMPLLGRYVFAGATDQQPTREIRFLMAVSFVALNARRIPLVVDHRAMQAVVNRMQAFPGGVIDLTGRSPAPRFLPGDTVRIAEGPFSGFEGLFVREEGERIRVLVGLFGGQSETTLPVSAIAG